MAEVPQVEARYNIAPTQEILAVRELADEREMAFFKWGLVPSWANGHIHGRTAHQRKERDGGGEAFR